MGTIKIYPEKCKIPKLSGVSSSVILEVDYDYDYDPGVYRDRNGEGYPPTEEITINSITAEGDIIDLLYQYAKTQNIINEIETKISSYERD